MAAKNLKLRYICLIHRHGDRAPINFLPDDPNVHHWPNGQGALTKAGRIQMYNLGRALRKRYDVHLGDKPLAKDLYVRSTDTDRCLASAQCCLAGLFPPVDDEDKVSPELNWQPVPVHTVPYVSDPLAIHAPYKYRHPPSGTYENPQHNQLYQTMLKHQQLWKKVDEISKCNGSFMDIVVALDTIVLEAQHKLPIPKELEGRMDELVEVFKSAGQLHCVRNMETRLSAVCLLDETLTNMEKLVDLNSSSTRSSTLKTTIYSLHDVNMITLISLLTKEIVRCPSASCLILELHEDVDHANEFYVKILFLKSDIEEDLLELKFQGRTALVHFKEFKSFVRNFIQETHANHTNNCKIEK